MSAFGSEVQIGPRDRVAAGPCCQPAQAQPPQHGAESDLDADHFELRVGAAGKHHVRDTGQALSCDIDHLGIQNITAQEDFVQSQRIFDRSNREAVRILGEGDDGVLNRLKRRRRDQEVAGSAPSHQYPINPPRSCVIAEVHHQVAKAADQLAVRIKDVLTDHPAEKQHPRSMPEQGRLGVGKSPNPLLGSVGALYRILLGVSVSDESAVSRQFVAFSPSISAQVNDFFAGTRKGIFYAVYGVLAAAVFALTDGQIVAAVDVVGPWRSNRDRCIGFAGLAGLSVVAVAA